MKVTFEVTSGESSVGGSLSKTSGPVGFCPDLQRKASYNLSNIFSLVSVEAENDWVIWGECIMELNFLIVSIAHKENSGRENLSEKTKVIHLLTRCSVRSQCGFGPRNKVPGRAFPGRDSILVHFCISLKDLLNHCVGLAEPPQIPTRKSEYL